VSIADSNSVMTFGAEPQRRMKRPAPDTPPGK